MNAPGNTVRGTLHRELHNGMSITIDYANSTRADCSVRIYFDADDDTGSLVVPARLAVLLGRMPKRRLAELLELIESLRVRAMQVGTEIGRDAQLNQFHRMVGITRIIDALNVGG